jgi:serine/threonine protein kinase
MDKRTGSSEILGEGSYGVTVKPPVPCKKTKVKKGEKDKLIGKLLRYKNAKPELSISTIIQGIPGYERYFIVYEKDNCTTENFKKFRSAHEKEEIDIFKKAKNNELVQLLSNYGGGSLFDLQINDNFEYIRHFRHLLEAVSKLNKQGVCHFDIKFDNIVVDFKYVMRIIDFGISFVGNTLTEDDMYKFSYEFSADYYPWPPEVNVRQGLKQGMSLQEAVFKTIKEKEIFYKKQTILGIPNTTDRHELYTFSMDTYSISNLEFYKTYWNKFDVWAVGVIFLKLLYKCFLHPGFITRVWTEKGNSIKKVLKGLLEADPRKRMSADEALTYFS